jgi:hypothetical protein
VITCNLLSLHFKTFQLFVRLCEENERERERERERGREREGDDCPFNSLQTQI